MTRIIPGRWSDGKYQTEQTFVNSKRQLTQPVDALDDACRTHDIDLSDHDPQQVCLTDNALVNAAYKYLFQSATAGFVMAGIRAKMVSQLCWETLWIDGGGKKAGDGERAGDDDDGNTCQGGVVEIISYPGGSITACVCMGADVCTGSMCIEDAAKDRTLFDIEMCRDCSCIDAAEVDALAGDDISSNDDGDNDAIANNNSSSSSSSNNNNINVDGNEDEYVSGSGNSAGADGSGSISSAPSLCDGVAGIVLTAAYDASVASASQSALKGQLFDSIVFRCLGGSPTVANGRPVYSAGTLLLQPEDGGGYVIRSVASADGYGDGDGGGHVFATTATVNIVKLVETRWDMCPSRPLPTRIRRHAPSNQHDAKDDARTADARGHAQRRQEGGNDDFANNYNDDDDGGGNGGGNGYGAMDKHRHLLCTNLLSFTYLLIYSVYYRLPVQ